MTQSLLIVAISVIAAVVVGSGVFFVWTFLERLTNRSRAAGGADVTGDEEPEQTEADESGQDT